MFVSDMIYRWLPTINISHVKGRVTLTEVIEVMNIDRETDVMFNNSKDFQFQTHECWVKEEKYRSRN